MNIVVYGDRPGLHSGAWCYAETLTEMGHNVVRIYATVGLEPYFDTLVGRAARRVLGGPAAYHRRRHARALIAAAEQHAADIVIVLKGLNIAPEDVRALQSLGAWVALINHDDFFSANPNNRSGLQLRALPIYDFVFATRPVNVDEVKPLNPNVEFFPFAYYPPIHCPIPLSDEDRIRWASDVVFVGTWEAERAALLECLVRAVPAKLVIWGSQWEKTSRNSVLRPCIRHQSLSGDDMSRAVGAAHVALAFLRKENRDEYTQRTFEIPACRGVLLAERTPQHLAFYREGIEAEFFDPTSPSELIDKTRLLLADSTRREALRDAGHAAVIRGKHTYQDRLTRLLEVHASRTR